jgi:uncharacterized membrane protein YhfC
LSNPEVPGSIFQSGNVNKALGVAVIVSMAIALYNAIEQQS